MSPSSSAADRAVETPASSDGSICPEPQRAIIRLPDRLDFAAARDLHADLVELRGVPVLVDGTAVVFSGALAAQVLLATSRDWKAVGETLALTVSSAMHSDLVRLGVLGEFPQLVEVAEC
ncbi:MAG: hypothetical protein U1E69_03710 [Tabrizicola sp.]|uniref:STAS domain-containing protein n=1 Tax=Tabrizicola sp. TaxID=2005166 RepID=UPI002ABB2987|nr:hypothetical protein [Tabrizicola sp.]MDZ4085890.1 hypothetical protein [Tabrizicola sp.]